MRAQIILRRSVGRSIRSSLTAASLCGLFVVTRVPSGVAAPGGVASKDEAVVNVAGAQSAGTAAPRDLMDDFETGEAGRRIDEVIEAANAGEPTASLVYGVADFGMVALWAAAEKMDFDRESHRRPFLLLAERVAGVRKCYRELLRLYDRAAYRAFYMPEGAKLQATIARALDWENPPPNTPAALVMAAPQPTLAWLAAQCEGPVARPGLLLDLLRTWGGVVATGREPQYGPALRALAERLTRSAGVQADEKLVLGVIRFVSDVSCQAASGYIAAALAQPVVNVRRAAAEALGRLGGAVALQALLARASAEADPLVQAPIAEALGRWPDEPAAGAACLALFERAHDLEVRRAILFAAGDANWPDRTRLIHRAFEVGGGRVLGAALSIKPVPGLEDTLLGLLADYQGKTPEPSLVDALAKAHVAAAAPPLIHALEDEKNIGMRLKLIYALEGIGTTEAGAALVRLLEETADPLEAEHLINAVGRLRLAAAGSQLARLARDPTAPVSVRVQALWGLGCMPNGAGRGELEAIHDHFAELFSRPAGGARSLDEDIHLRAARPHVLLALLHAGSSSAGEEISRLFGASGPLEQTQLLGGLLDQKTDHPIIAEGLRSPEFAVLYVAIAAGRAANPKKYWPLIQPLAASPIMQAVGDLGTEAWRLSELLKEP